MQTSRTGYATSDLQGAMAGWAKARFSLLRKPLTVAELVDGLNAVLLQRVPVG